MIKVKLNKSKLNTIINKVMSPAVFMMKIESKIMINNRKRNMKRKLSTDIQLNAINARTTIHSGKFLHS